MQGTTPVRQASVSKSGKSILLGASQRGARPFLIFALTVLLCSCARIPKQYDWSSVDCSYQRGTEGLERDQVQLSCDLKGRAELGPVELPFR